MAEGRRLHDWNSDQKGLPHATCNTGSPTWSTNESVARLCFWCRAGGGGGQTIIIRSSCSTRLAGNLVTWVTALL